MEQSTPTHSVKLTDRTLWFDGQSSVSDALVEDALYALHRGDIERIFVEEITSTVQQFNRMSVRKIDIRDPATVVVPKPQWPAEILAINVDETASALLHTFLASVPTERHELYIARVVQELELYHERGLGDILRACIHIVNKLRAQGVVWGVGRGSSVASFVLYLIGVHDVDSVKYGLDIHEFLGEE